MARKKAQVKPKSDRVEEPGKVLFQMRMEAELHRKMASAAEAAGISLNQLIHGICEACMGKVNQGEVRLVGDVREVHPLGGCVWFGERERLGYSEEEYAIAEQEREHLPEFGRVLSFWFMLDHSKRGPVRY
jgi:hypothetical protein